MGYKLAAQVQQQWSHLDHGPYRLLIGIALALPEDSTRCWFGRDRFAQLLGKTPVTEAEKENAYKSVQRTIKALITAGALQLVAAAKPGRSAVYQLIFAAADGGHSASTISGMGDVQCPPLEREWGTLSVRNGGRSVSPMGDVQGPERGTVDVHPKKNEEELQEEVKKISPTRSPAAPDPRPDVEELCQRLSDLMQGNGARTPNISAAWRREARLLLDKDGVDRAEAMWVLEWCQADHFWKSNILSMPTFRQKYDQLRLKAGSGAQPGPWDKGFHANMNVLPQYAFANPPGKPSTGDKMRNTIELGRALQAQYDAREADLEAEFNEWFEAYPRQEGLADAQRAYTEARKAATAEQLLAGAERYAADPNRDPQYTKLPAKWLASKGWQDSPLPLRRTGTSEDRMRANLQVLDGWSPGPQVDVFEQKALGQ